MLLQNEINLRYCGSGWFCCRNYRTYLATECIYWLYLILRTKAIISLHNFCVLLTVHLGIILVNNQLDAQFFFLIYLFQFSTCFEHPCAHHQENQLYRVFNLKVDRQLSRQYFTSDAIYNGSAGMTLSYYMCRSWQDCCRRGENRSWLSVSVESVDSEWWCLNKAIFTLS